MKFTSLVVAIAGVSAVQHHHHHGHGHAHGHDKYRMQRARKTQWKRDAYDGDPTTVSPYDDMYQHKKFDWGVAEGEPGSKGPWGQYHGTWVDMR